ncbi:MAG: CBS domain-containing protein [Deferribacteres bacterium]|nr:CBS domain-containing protein [Deferribacteres bacterium]
MKIIVTHDNSDFDAIACVVAAKKLYPDAVPVMPSSLEKNVRDFLRDSGYDIEFMHPSRVEPEDVELIICVDSKRIDRSRVLEKVLKKGKPVIHIYDHHPAHPKNISGDVEIIEDTGACITIMVDIMRKKGIEMTAEEATIFALGLYEDTGFFTFTSTTPKDLEVGAFLLSRGANLNIVSDYLKRDLTPEQVELLNEMIKNLEVFRIAGIDVGITQISRDKYVGDLAVLAHKLRDMQSISALFVLARMDDKITLIARSRTEALNVGEIATEFGGGGHPTAASASIKDLTLTQVREKLLTLVRKELETTRTAESIMTSPPIIAFPELSLEEAEKIMVRYNINSLPVVDKGKVVGIITRQTVERALHHGLHEEKVEDYMNTEFEVATVHTSIKELEDIMLSRQQRMVPILDESGILVGVVTRGELLKALYEDMVKSSVSERKVPFKKGVKSILRERVPDWLFEIIKTAKRVGEKLGFNVYLVGGFVRDLLLRVENFDLDFVVEGDGITFAVKLAEALGGRVNVHEKFETAIVILPDDYRIDVATARLEYYEEPAALPKVMKGSIKRDLYRRDFTINAMAVKITGDDAYTLIDYYGGLKDLKDKVLRVIHNLSFVEDPTRAFRAVRFEQRYGFRIGPQTEKLIRIAVRNRLFEKLSGARIFSELRHILEEKAVWGMVKRLDKLGLLQFVHPELKIDERCERLFFSIQETLSWYELLFRKEKPEIWMINLMALFRNLDRSKLEAVLKRFGISKKERETVLQGISCADRVMGELKASQDPVAVYKTLTPYPLEAVLYFMAYAEEEEVKKKISHYLMELMDVKTEVRGRDLIKLGLTPGPIFGVLLNKLLEAKLRGEVKNKEEELEYLKRLLKEQHVA